MKDPTALAGLLIAFAGLLISAGVLAWFGKVRRAYTLAELGKTFATKADLERAEKRISDEATGLRSACRRDIETVERTAAQASAAAQLALTRAEAACDVSDRVSTLLEAHHERVMEEILPAIREQARVVSEVAKITERQGGMLDRMGREMDLLHQKLIGGEA